MKIEINLPDNVVRLAEGLLKLIELNCVGELPTVKDIVVTSIYPFLEQELFDRMVSLERDFIHGQSRNQLQKDLDELDEIAEQARELGEYK